MTQQVERPSIIQKDGGLIWRAQKLKVQYAACSQAYEQTECLMQDSADLRANMSLRCALKVLYVRIF